MNKQSKKKAVTSSLTALIALALAACAAPGAKPSGGAAAPAGAPIKIGMTSGQSGPFVEIEPEAIVKAYIAKVNAEGGIGGRMLEVMTADDKTDPAVAGQSVHRMIDSDGVVAMVGSASALDCAVNGAYYVEKGVVSIPGTGVDPVCFLNPNISPVNTGPFSAARVLLQYANQTLKRDKLCAYFAQIPGTEPAYRDAVAKWEASSGLKMTVNDYSFKNGDDPTPLVLAAKAAGCNAVLLAVSSNDSVAWMRAAKTQNLQTDITWLVLASAYTADVAKTLGADGEGLLVNSELQPWSTDDAALKGWKDLSTSAKVPLTTFSLGSYLAMEIFVNTLKGIQGEINRESVAKAFKALPPVNSPLLGTPYTFGAAPMHNSNQASKIMVLKGGKWALAIPDWVVVADKK